MIKANIKVGGATIQIEAEKQVDVVKQAGFWGECPTKCGKCDSERIGFFSRSPGGNLYVGMKCKECKSEFNFGQNKDGGTLYIKHDQGWQDEYSGGNQDQGDPRQNQEHQSHHQQAPPSSGHGGAQDDDDIPY